MDNLREMILAAPDLQTEPVAIPEWGISLNVRTMTGAERDAFEAENYKRSKKGEKGVDFSQSMQNIRARLVVRTVVDADGQRLFKDEDAEALGGKNGIVMDRLYAVAARLSGIRQEDVEELAKN